jgi:adenosylcobinamide-GDP ribazoletransferase
MVKSAFRGVVSFLTKIPLKTESLEETASNSYLFPIVGLIIGIFVFTVGFFSFKFLDENIASMITLLSIYSITGLMHLDGLSDFFDGIMASGEKHRKISAMKDANVGSAGVFSVVITIILIFFSIRLVGDGYDLLCAIVISEVSAKLSMNTCIFLGKKITDGMASVFIARSTPAKYAIAILTSVLIALIAGTRFPLVFIGVIVASILVHFANANFGGVNGDVIGASNEIARVVTLVVWGIIY